SEERCLARHRVEKRRVRLEAGAVDASLDLSAETLQHLKTTVRVDSRGEAAGERQPATEAPRVEIAEEVGGHDFFASAPRRRCERAARFRGDEDRHEIGRASWRDGV